MGFLLLPVRKRHSHPSHGQRRSQFQHPLPGVQPLPVNLDDDVILGADLDPRLGIGGRGRRGVQPVENIGDRAQEPVCQVARADDGAFDRRDGDVEKVVPVGPRDVRRVLVVVLAEEQAEDRLQAERIQFDRDVNQREMRLLEVIEVESVSLIWSVCLSVASGGQMGILRRPAVASSSISLVRNIPCHPAVALQSHLPER